MRFIKTRSIVPAIVCAQLCLALPSCSAPPDDPSGQPDQQVACYDRVLALSAYDRELSTRREHKSEAAQKAESSGEFVVMMLESKEDGDAFACGLTRAWVTEVFEGLEPQYAEYRYDDGIDGSKAGYQAYTGDELIALFQGHAGREEMVIYRVRHTGTEDHVLTIEQLPRGQGYRIYQSYNGAYSLNAWLSGSTDGLFEPDTREIIVWRGLQAAVNDFLSQVSGGEASLDNLDALPADWQFARPYYEYVRGYDQEKIMTNFEPAWETYGKGRVLSEAELFGDYLLKTAELTAYFAENDHASDPFPQEIWDTWIGLYASPNPLHFPGLPHDFVTDLLLADRNYRLEALDVVLSADDASVRAACMSNARILEDAILKAP